MASDNDVIFPYKRVPKPPITEYGDSLDSGLGPSIESTEYGLSGASPDDSVQHFFPREQYAGDLADIDLRYYMSEEDIPQIIFDDLKGSSTLFERGSTTYPGPQLEQKPRHEDQRTYDFGPDHLNSRACTSCGHNLAEYGACCELPEDVSSCHVCCNAPAHDMRACVARSKTIFSPIRN